MKIGLIGAGNMNGAIYKALLNKFDKADLLVCDLDKDKLKELGVLEQNRFLDHKKMLAEQGVKVVILGVKPQVFGELDFENLLKDKLVVSIMAGISLEKLQKVTKSNKIARTMPNLAAQVGQSLTGWIASEGVLKQERDLVKDILSLFGEQIELTNEDEINKITALSGSGPAYFFYLTELLEQKAVEFGFTPEQAQKIAKTTFLGAAKALENGNLGAKEYKQGVTSKGGTTQAALEYLQDQNWDQIFKKALDKGKNRAEELGK